MAFWSSSTPRTTNRSPVRKQRAVLQLEVLEGRDCPSGAQITSFSANVQSGHQVLLSGTILDSAPGAAVINFGGTASGSVVPDLSGHFQVLENISQLGAVFATATDPDGSVSNTARAVLTDPGISLTLSATQGANRTVTVTGQVSCPSPAGLTVAFSGIVSGTVTTSSNGTFTFVAPASALGQIQATVTDVWGVSATAATTLCNTPPTIINFRAINNGYNCWTFTGQVQDEYAAGLVVRLSGIPTLNGSNAVATVQANGTFSYTIMLSPGEGGSVTASCIDWWGQASNQATTFVLS